ncbi:hypothetical protein ACHAXT_000480 [Thalassiosira profunda]
MEGKRSPYVQASRALVSRPIMGKESAIRAADDLWFGSNGVARDREAAVAVFGSLAAGNDGSRGDIIDEAATRRDYGAAPCEDGECCAQRRRRGAAAGDENNRRLNRSICIVGAGPSGLVTLRELAHRGFANITCYEASSDIGGAFASAYNGAVMTSSNVLTAFGCYPLSEYEKNLAAQKQCGETGGNVLRTEAGMWTCKEYTQYLHTFSRRYKLQQYIKTNVGVIYIRALEGGRWEVHLSTRDNTRWIETYDAVCICSGLHQSRNIPVWVNVKPPMRKDVSIMHSSQFNAEDVRDKNVLVIGLGESGSDISLLASRVAKSVKISFREKSGSGYVLPRYTGGEVSDLNTSRGFGRHNMWGRADYRRFAALADDAVEDEDAAALTELSRCFVGTDAFSPLDLLAIKWNAGFNNRPYDRFGTKNYSFLEAVCSYGAELVGEVSSWGDVPSDCDALILCTGFEARFPFFDSNSHPEVDLGVSASNHRERYQHTIDLSVGPSLAFIGYSRPAFGAIPPLSEMAARYWALLLTGERTIGPSARAEAAADQAYEERLFYRDASRLPALVQYHRSMDNLAKLIGCFPPLEELRINHREVCDRILHSSLSGVQYRLCGEGSMEAAWSDISRHPLPVFTRQPRSAFHAKAGAGLFGCAKDKSK